MDLFGIWNLEFVISAGLPAVSLGCYLARRTMKFIKSLEENESVTSYGRIRKKQVRLKKNGEPYLRLLLGDSTGRIEGKMWENIEEFEKEIQEGDFVQYQGVVQTYNGSKQLIVKRIRKALPEDSSNGFNVKDLIPCTEI